MTDRYKVVQNEEAFAFTDALLGEGVRYETAGSLQGGRKVWLLAHLPQAYIIAGERISPYLVFSNTHDGSGAIRVAVTSIRVVCNNTLNLALTTARRSWSAIHTGDIRNKMEEAKNTLFLANAYMDELGREFESLLHDFLVYTSNHFPQVHSTIREQVGICRKEFQGTFINGRFADCLGQFFAISEILGDFLAGVSNVDTILLVEQLKKSVADILHRNNAKMKERTLINFIARALFDFAESDKCVEWGDPVNDLETYMIKAEAYYYVKESHLPNIVAAYAKQNVMMYLKMSSQEIAKILENENVVTRIREGDTWRYSKKYPQYHRTRLMKLDVEMLKRAI